MFKKIACSGFILSMLALPLFAQQTTTPTSVAPAADAAAADAPATAQRTNRRQNGQMADPATRARRQTDRIAKFLNLDQATTQKLYDADLARTQQVDVIMKGTDDKKARQKALKANADAYKAKLQTILTPDQVTKLEQMKDKMKNRMRNRQGVSENGDKETN